MQTLGFTSVNPKVCKNGVESLKIQKCISLELTVNLLRLDYFILSASTFIQ